MGVHSQSQASDKRKTMPSHVEGSVSYTYVNHTFAQPQDMGPYVKSALQSAGLVQDTRANNPPGATIGDFASVGGSPPHVTVTITFERPNIPATPPGTAPVPLQDAKDFITGVLRSSDV
jgi:hypothetical protein